MVYGVLRKMMVSTWILNGFHLEGNKIGNILATNNDPGPVLDSDSR